MTMNKTRKIVFLLLSRQLMEIILHGARGADVVRLVEMELKFAFVIVPILHRPTVVVLVWDPAMKKRNVSFTIVQVML